MFYSIADAAQAPSCRVNSCVVRLSSIGAMSESAPYIQVLTFKDHQRSRMNVAVASHSGMYYTIWESDEKTLDKLWNTSVSIDNPRRLREKTKVCVHQLLLDYPHLMYGDFLEFISGKPSDMHLVPPVTHIFCRQPAINSPSQWSAHDITEHMDTPLAWKINLHNNNGLWYMQSGRAPLQLFCSGTKEDAIAQTFNKYEALNDKCAQYFCTRYLQQHSPSPPQSTLLTCGTTLV